MSVTFRMPIGVSWTAENGKSDGDPPVAVTGNRGKPGTVRERFGPSERAGTFEITVADLGSGATRPVEFAVWRTTRTGRRVLWFTGKDVLPVAAVSAVRVLEVWTDRAHGYPCKVVFLKK